MSGRRISGSGSTLKADDRGPSLLSPRRYLADMTSMSYRLVRHGFALAVAATIFLTGVASAQPVATSFEQLHELVKSGDTIYVTDSTGRTTKGKLGNLSSASLEL